MSQPAEAFGRLLAPFAGREDQLLPILHAFQDELGFIPPEAVGLIARHVNLSAAEVHGVITYYHHFRQQPPGRHVVRVCCAEACQANGAEALATHAQTLHDGVALTVEPVFCLGLCASGPAVQIDEHRLYARVTPARLDALVTALDDEP